MFTPALPWINLCLECQPRLRWVHEEQQCMTVLIGSLSLQVKALITAANLHQPGSSGVKSCKSITGILVVLLTGKNDSDVNIRLMLNAAQRLHQGDKRGAVGGAHCVPPVLWQIPGLLL